MSNRSLSLASRILRGAGVAVSFTAALMLVSRPTIGQSRPGAPAAGSVLLRLRAGAFDPLRRATVQAIPPATPSSGAAAATALYVVQFSGPIRAPWRQALEATGAAVLEYLPDFSYLVRAQPAAAARFGSLPGHRWHGPFEAVRAGMGTAPPARIAARSRGQDAVTLDVMTLPGEDVHAVARRLPGRVLQQVAGRRGFLRVQVAPGDVTRVGATPGVEWVEPYQRPVLFNDVAAGLMQVPAARAVVGLYGRGQVVAVADTGLDTGSMSSLSADFRGRIRHAYALSRSAAGDWSDLHGHGTHVCGSVLGAGVLSGSDPAHHRYDGSFAGMAPEANLVIQSIGDATGFLTLPDDFEELFRTPYQNDGARIHSDSWGSSDPDEYGEYLSTSWKIDDACWQMRDLVVVFAAGNEGIDADGDGVVDANSLSPEATAKNEISVGSSESFRDNTLTWGHFSMFPSDPIWGSRAAGDPNGMAAYSSRGPTADGRIKPDLVTPGTWILSTRSHAAGAGTLWGAYNADYVYSGGTSMSAPLAAGAAALVREGLQEQYGVADPSSALVKAVLLNGADDLAPGQYGDGATREIPPRPNPVEGWGRLDLRQSLALGGGAALLPIEEPAGLQTQEERRYPLTVAPGEGPLRVTLVWTDPPSSVLAGPQLVNDLDLTLLTPDGRSLPGNGAPDRLNNVESVELPNPPPGNYTVVVDGYNVPEGPQPFAVAISGPLQPPAATGLRVTVSTASPALPVAAVDLAVAGPRTVTLTASTDGGIAAPLPAGSYTFTPSLPGWSFDPPSRTVTLTDGQVQAAAFTATASLGTLAGTLTGADGKPLAGVAVTLSPGGLSTVTAADGSYRFAAVPPVSYTVAPVLAGTTFTPAAGPVRVPAGGAARADFSIAAEAVAGTIIAVGPPLPQVIASPHPTGTIGSRRYPISQPGAHWIRVHFTRIDVQPHAESVSVLDDSGRAVNRWSGAVSHTWSAWIPGSSLTILHAARGYAARFGFEVDQVQTDLGAQPLPNATVALQPGGRATQTDADGHFRFDGLSGSRFDLAPALGGWSFFPPTASVTLPAGTSQDPITFLAQSPSTQRPN